MVLTDQSPPHAGVPDGPRPDLARAWTSIALIPLFFLLAFAAGEGVSSLLGYEAGTGSSPWWVTVLTDVTACGVLLVPCVAAVLFGRRARRSRVRGALVPILVGAVVGLAGLILTIVSEVGNPV